MYKRIICVFLVALIQITFLTCSALGDEIDCDKKTLEECVSKYKTAGYFVLSFKVDKNGNIQEIIQKDSVVLKPNKPIALVIEHEINNYVKFEVEGITGEYSPDIQKLGSETKRMVTHQTFPAQMPGKITVKVFLKKSDNEKIEAIVNDFLNDRLKEKAKEKANDDDKGDADIDISVITGEKPKDNFIEKYSREIIVVTPYQGAMRIGFGIFGGEAVERYYEGRDYPNSRQKEIVCTNENPVDIELVLGYAHFFEKGGRSHTYDQMNNEGGFWKYWAPYVGIGLVAHDQETAIDIFKSFYLGGEWEPSQHFSLAFTAVFRRVERLDGVKLGGPVDTPDVPTKNDLGIGYGIVLNISPEFFKFASKTKSNILK